MYNENDTFNILYKRSEKLIITSILVFNKILEVFSLSQLSLISEFVMKVLFFNGILSTEAKDLNIESVNYLKIKIKFWLGKQDFPV